MQNDLNQRVRELLTDGDEIGAIKLLRQEQNLSLHAARERVTALAGDIKGSEPQNAAYIFTSIGGFVLMAVLALSGFVSLASAKHLHDYWHSAEWPTTRGVITRSQRDNIHGAGTPDGPRIEYRFSVDGTEYQSRRWGFPLIDAGPGSNIKGILARYPRGAKVRVHYDPEYPQHALLDTDLQGPWIWLLAFVIGLPLYLWYRRFARRVEVRSRARALDASRS